MTQEKLKSPSRAQNADAASREAKSPAEAARIAESHARTRGPGRGILPQHFVSMAYLVIHI